MTLGQRCLLVVDVVAPGDGAAPVIGLLHREVVMTRFAAAPRQ
jgi:hypothetical protein